MVSTPTPGPSETPDVPADGAGAESGEHGAGPAPLGARAPGVGRDWTADVAARIESTVALAREKTTVPATLAARGVVYGLIVGVLGAALLFVVVLAVVRICDVYLPFQPRGRRVWVTYAGASAIFLLAGAFLWRMRRPKSARVRANP